MTLFNCSFAVHQLNNLRKGLHITRLAAYADGTHKIHQTQWRAFLLFCGYFNLPPLPASLETLCLYCQFLSRSMIPASVRNYLSGVKLLHLLAGQDISLFKSYELTIIFKGLQRLAKHVPSRAPPVTPEILLQLVSLVDFTNPVEVTFMSAFLFTFFLLARVSNIVPRTSASFNPSLHLCRGDIVLTSTGLVVLFKHTKTIQFGKRRLLLPLLRMPNSLLCPVQIFEHMCSLVPATLQSPAFLQLTQSGRMVPVTKSQYVAFFRALLRRAGIPDYLSFRGHSFRRGAASWAFRLGVPGEIIQVYGDWASDAYKSHLEISMSAKLQLASHMRQALT